EGFQIVQLLSDAGQVSAVEVVAPDTVPVIAGKVRQIGIVRQLSPLSVFDGRILPAAPVVGGAVVGGIAVVKAVRENLIGDSQLEPVGGPEIPVVNRQLKVVRMAVGGLADAPVLLGLVPVTDDAAAVLEFKMVPEHRGPVR